MANQAMQYRKQFCVLEPAVAETPRIGNGDCSPVPAVGGEEGVAVGLRYCSRRSWIFPSIFLAGKKFLRRVPHEKVPPAMDREHTTVMLVQAFKVD